MATWKLYWCTNTQDKRAGDYFVIARSADEACYYHACEGDEDPVYDPKSCTAELITSIPAEIATPFRRFLPMDYAVLRPRIFGASGKPFNPWPREFAMLGIRTVPAVFARGGKKYPRHAFQYKGRWFVPRGTLLVHNSSVPVQN